MQKILFVGVGGFVGAVLRYLISGLVYETWGVAFPYGTLVVNVVGAFILGFIVSITNEHLFISPDLKIVLTVGVLGAFTTFSTFCYESMSLIQTGNTLRATLNIFISVLLGLIFVFIGIKTGKLI
jgi:CrcB protein